MMPFDTPLPPMALALIGLLLLVLLVGMARRQRAAVPRGVWLGLMALRVLVVAMLLLLLANPFIVEQHPDAEGFRVALLADVSGSMHTQDLDDGESRIDFVTAQLNNSDGNLRTRLSSRYQLDSYVFSDELRTLRGEPAIGPGVTAIGDSLEDLLTQTDGEKRLAAAVLLSDGISLQGIPLMEAARALRQADIPVSVIGVGERSSGGDVGVELEVATAEPLVGEPVELETRVTNTFTRTVNITVETATGDTVLGRHELSIAPGEIIRLSDIAEPTRAGLHTYRTRITEAPARDVNQANDMAFATAEVSEPRVMKALYLSSHLNDNFRFLRQVMRKDPDWNLQAVVRLNDERFTFIGFDEPPEDEQADFNDAADAFYDNSVLVIETAVVRELDEAGREALRNFLTRRGGGVLFFGAPDNLSTDLRNLLPVREVEAVDRPRQLPLEVVPDPVFADLAGGTLFRPPPVFLPEGKTAFFATELSRGGRVALATQQGELPLLTLHAYGAGRVAYLGSAATWRWRMSSEHGTRQHELFWRYLLGWLGAGGKPRVEIPLQGELLPVGEPLALDIDLRGPDFRPAEDASVRATLFGADGEPGPEVNLVADPSQPGRYRALTTLDQPGEYRVDYRITFPDGEALEEEAWFAGAYLGRENDDLAFRERELRDLARITGGDYHSWRDVGKLDELMLSATIPLQESRWHWTRNLTFLLLLIAFAGSEWIIRRRVGLT